MIAEVKRHGKILTIVSNASLITEARLQQLLRSDLDVLGLSLYDNNHRHVERVVRAIDGRMKYWVQTVVTSGSIGQIETLIDFCLRIGCRDLQLSNCVPIGGMDPDLAIFDDNEEYLETERRLRAKYRRHPIRISWIQLLRRKPARRACAMPFSYVHVDNQGNLGACCMRPPDGERFGNIYRDTDAWNLPYYLKLRESMFDGAVEPLDVCKHCDNLHHDLYRI
jgi:MoaA/NifB/PqqE/SkfB family radical SAM enzyme